MLLLKEQFIKQQYWENKFNGLFKIWIEGITFALSMQVSSQTGGFLKNDWKSSHVNSMNMVFLNLE